MAKLRQRSTHITVKREHGGLYWMDQEEFEKIAPNLEPDSTEEFFVTIRASNCKSEKL